MSAESRRGEDEATIEEDIALFERLAERYADREEGRVFELAAQSLKEAR